MCLPDEMEGGDAELLNSNSAFLKTLPLLQGRTVGEAQVQPLIFLSPSHPCYICLLSSSSK